MEKELTIEELEQQLAKKKKALAEKRLKAIDAYETDREERINDLIEGAFKLDLMLDGFKGKCHLVMNEQYEKLEEFGKIRSNSKGGFTITNKAGTKRITRMRSTEPYWDERSTKAVALIKEFLYDTVKKRDKKVFEILLSFIEKNKQGDLEYSRVMQLVQHEDKYDDPRWREGLDLIKQSFNNRLKGYQYEFKEVGEDGKWKTYQLNFSSH